MNFLKPCIARKCFRVYCVSVHYKLQCKRGPLQKRRKELHISWTDTVFTQKNKILQRMLHTHKVRPILFFKCSHRALRMPNSTDIKLYTYGKFFHTIQHCLNVILIWYRLESWKKKPEIDISETNRNLLITHCSGLKHMQMSSKPLLVNHFWNVLICLTHLES